MEMIYGIDLGTSNCLASRYMEVIDEQEVSCLIDNEGNTEFPSVVHFTDENGIVIGDKAKQLLPEKPEQTIELVKIRMGKQKEISVYTKNKKFKLSPQEISASLLNNFKEKYSDDIKKAVLTVPAYFDQNQRQATMQAGKIANIEIAELIDEPSAAIFYHLFNKYKNDNYIDFEPGESRNYLVFDFGGGTLDLSLIQFSLDSNNNLKPTVLLKSGDNELGGNVIDFKFAELIIDYIYYDSNKTGFIKRIKEEYKYYQENYRFRSNLDYKIKEFIMTLKSTIEDAKISLSTKKEYNVQVGYGFNDYLITREDFEYEILENYFRKPVSQALESLIEENKSKGDHKIDEIVMVGGTSQIPYFQKLLKYQFPQLNDKVIVSDEYDRAIAKGAAIFGAILAGRSVKPFGKNRFKNIVSHNIYIEQKNTNNLHLLVEKGKTYPFDSPVKCDMVIGHALDKNINIRLREEYQKYNKSTDIRESTKRVIKKLKFYHPFFYKGEDIGVEIQIDEHGIFHFIAKHKLTGEEIDFEADKIYQLKEEEIKEAGKRIREMGNKINP